MNWNTFFIEEEKIVINGHKATLSVNELKKSLIAARTISNEILFLELYDGILPKIANLDNSDFLDLQFQLPLFCLLDEESDDSTYINETGSS